MYGVWFVDVVVQFLLWYGVDVVVVGVWMFVEVDVFVDGFDVELFVVLWDVFDVEVV